MNIKSLSVTLIVGAAFLAGASSVNAQGPGGGLRPMVHSNAFEDGGVVPPKFVMRGDNVQPGFTFTDVPENAVSIALIFHDIDVALGGGTDDVLHWTAWNIPAAGGIPEGGLPDGAVNGPSIRGQPGYMGPGAPVGERYHHYVWEFYFLSENLDLPATASRADLLAAMQGKVVNKAAYVGRYRGTE